MSECYGSNISSGGGGQHILDSVRLLDCVLSWPSNIGITSCETPLWLLVRECRCCSTKLVFNLGDGNPGGRVSDARIDDCELNGLPVIVGLSVISDGDTSRGLGSDINEIARGCLCRR